MSLVKAVDPPQLDTLVPNKGSVIMSRHRYGRIILAGSFMLAVYLTSTGCEALLPEKTSDALDFSCEGCHTNKSLIQSLASSEVEVPEGGG